MVVDEIDLPSGTLFLHSYTLTTVKNQRKSDSATGIRILYPGDHPGENDFRLKL
jgi:hypothetical protein